MIEFLQDGNLLEADVDALVNTVNEVGVMGKGIALTFRKAFPENTEAYAEACRRREVRVGHMFVTRRVAPTGPAWIINFPTKKHWRSGSRIDWVRDGLNDLVRVIRENDIRSIAIPALGCGNGGLDWAVVRPLMEATLGELDDVRILVFEPSSAHQDRR